VLFIPPVEFSQQKDLLLFDTFGIFEAKCAKVAQEKGKTTFTRVS
jgi:hypothetical protein